MAVLRFVYSQTYIVFALVFSRAAERSMALQWRQNKRSKLES